MKGVHPLDPTTPTGFRMPGEFEPHAGCWMLFPERPDVWRENAEPAQQVFANVATAIAQFEPVTVCASSKTIAIARQLLPKQIRVLPMAYDDAWMRDVGPTFVVDNAGILNGIDWEFNAWGGLNGGLYYPWHNDNAVAQRVLENAGIPRYKSDLVNEGGAIIADGEGTLITTKSVLLNPNRNPHLSQTDIEAKLFDCLGVTKIYWLDVAGADETDGHVDGICHFVRPGVVILSWTDDPNSHDYHTCRSVYDQLLTTPDAQGRTLEIIKLPLAELPPMTQAEASGISELEGTLSRQAGEPVFGGYINFYIANGGVVVPQFGVAKDELACAVLQEAFPDRKIVGVQKAREISLGGGNIHCITQQQPLGNLAKT